MKELAGCVIPNENQHLLLLRKASSPKEMWEMPVTELIPGESAVEAAARIAFESAGITTHGLREIGATKSHFNHFWEKNRWFMPASWVGRVRPRLAYHNDVDFFPVDTIVGERFSRQATKLAKLITKGLVEL